MEQAGDAEGYKGKGMWTLVKGTLLLLVNKTSL